MCGMKRYAQGDSVAFEYLTMHRNPTQRNACKTHGWDVVLAQFESVVRTEEDIGVVQDAQTLQLGHCSLRVLLVHRDEQAAPRLRR